MPVNVDFETNCPSHEILEDLLLGKIAEPDYERVATHFLHCASCAAKVETLSASDALTEAIRRRSLVATDDSLLNDVITRAKQLDPPQPTMATPISFEADPTGQPLADTVNLQDLSFVKDQASAGEIGRLGGYRLLEVLGAGGMGIVFRAEDPALNRQVALKVMRPAAAADESARDRFTREARATAAIEHDHIVTIYQVGEEKGVPFIAMPLLHGESLKSRLDREQALAPAEALRIAREVSLGLAAAHQQGLIHRDIKPDNIWLEADTGRVKIVDFGLVRNVIADPNANPELTQSGVVLGTPQYMSPEQARGKAVDHRSDLFSLGVLLYQMLSAKKAFQRDTLLGTLVAIEREEVPKLSTIGVNISRSMSDLVMRLLNKDPDDRFPTALALVEAIDQLSDSQESIPAERPKKFSRKHLTIGTAICGCLFLLGIIIKIFDQDGKQVGSIVVPEGGRFEAGAISSPSTVDEKKTPVGKSPHTKSQPRFVKTAAALSPLALTTTPAKISGLKSWSLETRYHRSNVYLIESSPDGKRLATAGYDGTIRIWNCDTLKPMQVLYIGPANHRLRSVAFSHDNRYLAYIANIRLHVLELTSGAEVYSLECSLPQNSGIALSFSSSGLLFARFGNDFVIDVGDQKVLRRRPAGYHVRWDAKGDNLLMLNTSSNENELMSWNPKTLRQHVVWVHKNAPRQKAYYSDDFSRFGYWDDELKAFAFRESQTNRLLSTAPKDNSEADPNKGYLMRWSPDGRSVAFDSWEAQNVRVYDVESGKQLPGGAIPAWNYIATWLNDSQRLAIWNTSGVSAATRQMFPSLRIVNVKTGDVLAARVTHHRLDQSMGRFDGPIRQQQLTFNPDATKMVSCVSQSNTTDHVQLWNLQRGRYADRLTISSVFDPYPVAWLESDRISGVGYHAGEANTLWNYRIATRLATEVHSQAALAAAKLPGKIYGLNPDKTQAICLDSSNGRTGQSLSVVNVLSGETLHTTKTTEVMKFSGFCCTNGGLFVPILDGTPTLNFWSVENGTLADTLDARKILGEASGFTSWKVAHVSPDSALAVVGYLANKDRRFFLWSFSDQKIIKEWGAEVSFLDERGLENVWIEKNRFIGFRGTHRETLVMFDRDGQALTEWEARGLSFGTFEISSDQSLLACAVTSTARAERWSFHRSGDFIQIRDMRDGRVLSTYCVLPTEYDYDLPLSFGPTGHWHSPNADEMRNALGYVAITDDGARLWLTPDEFEQKFGWKNDPAKVTETR